MVAIFGWLSLEGEGFLTKALAGSLVRQGARRQNFYGNIAFQLVAEIFPEHVPEHTGMFVGADVLICPAERSSAIRIR